MALRRNAGYCEHAKERLMMSQEWPDETERVEIPVKLFFEYALQFAHWQLCTFSLLPFFQLD